MHSRYQRWPTESPNQPKLGPKKCQLIYIKKFKDLEWPIKGKQDKPKPVSLYPSLTDIKSLNIVKLQTFRLLNINCIDTFFGDIFGWFRRSVGHLWQLLCIETL